MLTRLKVNGFKNLVDVDVYFGPFTCVAGVNAVGKSNLFDAIHFLSALADHSLIDAALSVRNEGGKTSDVKSLFHRVGNSYDREMTFLAEMIVPDEGRDDFGERAEATNTFLQYSVTIAYREDDDDLNSLGSLELKEEKLIHIHKKDAVKKLLFLPKKAWRDSVLLWNRRRTPPFISTEGDGKNRVIKLHQDGPSGQPLKRSAVRLPRTVLSAANAAESPTALLARREMQSWRLLQLEPSSLREPDGFRDPTRLGTDGSHLAATLYRLARRGDGQEIIPASKLETIASGNGSRIYGQIALRLSGLIDDVYEVWVDRDETRESLTLYVNDRVQTPHPARALSDGTLRFLALAVLELDPETKGLLCLEEPENGIHPERIPAMLKLLEDIAVAPDLPIGIDNPLRQVIVNTHSPAVVAQVSDNDLLVAELKEFNLSGKRFKKVCFSCLSDTWRAGIHGASIVPKGRLLSYMFVGSEEPEDKEDVAIKDHGAIGPKRRRVIDRDDLRQLRFSFPMKAAE
jgi:predicted ATPase